MSKSLFIDDKNIAQLRRDMVRFGQLQLRNAALAEDAVQEALTAAFASRDRFSGLSAMKTWIFSILRNKIVDLIRDQSRTTPISSFIQQEMNMDQVID